MKRISDLIRKVIMGRVDKLPLFDKYFKDNSDEWRVYIICRNAIEDTSSALMDYENNGLGNTYDEKYLRLYGMLQAVFLQQDAIKELYHLFTRNKLSNKGNSWSKIREIRNMSVGHPIKYERRGKIKRSSIVLVTLSDKGFQLVVWDKQKPKDEYINIDLQKVYKGYKEEAVRVLKDIGDQTLRFAT